MRRLSPVSWAVFRLLVGQRLLNVEGNLFHIAEQHLSRPAGEMRRHQKIFEREQRLVFGHRLLIMHIGRRRAETPRAQRRQQGIVIDESVTTGRQFSATTRGALPHCWLNSMGGSIGFGMPNAIGAALACPDRSVICMEGDGSAMYTEQSLWTMAREQLAITVVIFANRSYAILRGEFNAVGAGSPGQRATDMLSLDRPDLDWVAIARGHGVSAERVSDAAGFQSALSRGIASRGPSLIEVWL